MLARTGKGQHKRKKHPTNAESDESLIDSKIYSLIMVNYSTQKPLSPTEMAVKTGKQQESVGGNYGSNPVSLRTIYVVFIPYCLS